MTFPHFCASTYSIELAIRFYQIRIINKPSEWETFAAWSNQPHPET